MPNQHKPTKDHKMMQYKETEPREIVVCLVNISESESMFLLGTRW